MRRIRKESLEQLKQRVNLVDLLQNYLELKPAGASYKALCPFHDEKTPSFVVQRGDSHYHCFGCGAHGDAIAFLMEHQKHSFVEAVETLADRFKVFLEYLDGDESSQGPTHAKIKEALQIAANFFHQQLTQNNEAVQYLEKREISSSMMEKYSLGFAPKSSESFSQTMRKKGIHPDVLIAAGLAKNDQRGGLRPFFYDRILFPIHAPSGAIIGFSGRKFHEETFGGKYVNTPETPVFKKSRVLFGLNYTRKEIAKRRRALIVEGQIDVLRLLEAGFNWVVAAQGTAFGLGHVEELKRLGVQKVSLAMDGDVAGMQAATKIGNLFQKVGIGVEIIPIPKGLDPDSYLTERGPQEFSKLLEKGVDYLNFMVRFQSKQLNVESPADKRELVQTLAAQIKGWDDEVMIYESLKKLAHLTQVPEGLIGVGQRHVPNLYIQKSDSVGLFSINPDQILEGDCIRWLLTMPSMFSQLYKIAKKNLSIDHFRIPVCQSIYKEVLASDGENPPELLELSTLLDEEAQEFLNHLMKKRVNRDHAEENFSSCIQKILEREWMQKREVLRGKMGSSDMSDDEEIELIKAFDVLKNTRPKVVL